MPRRSDINKVMIIGSGPIVIGQACEFDYSGTQACKALRKLGYRIVLVNSNPATIMTDPGMADATYVEPLTLGALEQIIEKERPEGVIVQFGGQTPLNISGQLVEEGVRILGTTHETIDLAEDRDRFRQMMARLGIPQPQSGMASSWGRPLRWPRR